MPESVTDRKCCHKCFKTVTGKTKLSKCARCHSITYCSRECQIKDWPRHRQFCIPVMVTEINAKDLGLVASKDFKKGEVLYKETAVITVHAPSDMVPLQELKDQIDKMSEEQKTKFYQLLPRGNINEAQRAAALRENCLLELDIFLSNSYNKLDKVVLFLSSSLLNHSCAANVFLEKISDDDARVIATKDISIGEEVTECYSVGFMTRSQMKTKLLEDYSFDCYCGVCAGSIPHQDNLISEISSKTASLSSQSLDLLYQNKKEEWMTEASQLDRAAEMTKQLYIGHIKDKFRVFMKFINISQMARDPIRLKKAMNLLKEETSALGLMESRAGKNYKIMERRIKRWSSEFQSKRNPTKEEIDDFYRGVL